MTDKARKAVENAVEFGRKGTEFYRAAAENCDDPKVKGVLESLAKKHDKEKKLGVLLKEAAENKVISKAGGPEDDAFLEVLSNIHLLGKQDPAELARSAKSKGEVIDMALNFEKDTAIFHYEIACRMNDPKLQEYLMDLYNEEKKHIIKLSQVKEDLA